MSVATKSEFVSLKGAARILTVSPSGVESLIVRGLLWVRRIPGCTVKLRRAEVEALAEKYTHQPVEAV